ncbi:hypothetical protein ACVBGC_07945 [Burkholderia stagnalis]
MLMKGDIVARIAAAGTHAHDGLQYAPALRRDAPGTRAILPAPIIEETKETP